MSMSISQINEEIQKHLHSMKTSRNQLRDFIDALKEMKAVQDETIEHLECAAESLSQIV